MSLPECTVNTNNIQNLADSPTQSANELKQEFDKAGKDLKDYINEILIPAVEKLVKDEKANLETSINNKILADNKRKYPIGKIIMSTTNTNPNTYLGFGTWVAWGSGKVPVGVNTSDTDFNTSEKSGGSKTHLHSQGATGETKLTVAQIPPHSHPLSNNTLVNRNIAGSGGAQGSTRVLASTLTVGNTGGGQGHTHTNPNTNSSSTLQPYITCYMFKRTA